MAGKAAADSRRQTWARQRNLRPTTDTKHRSPEGICESLAEKILGTCPSQRNSAGDEPLKKFRFGHRFEVFGKSVFNNGRDRYAVFMAQGI